MLSKPTGESLTLAQEAIDTAVKATEDLAKEIADVDFATGALDLDGLEKQLQSALPSIEAEAMVNASVADGALIAAGSGATAPPPVVVTPTRDGLR